MTLNKRRTVCALLSAMLIFICCLHTGALHADAATKTASIKFRTYLQNTGWQAWKGNGSAAGGDSLRMEAFQVKLVNSGYKGSVVYRAHVQGTGWQKTWSKDGKLAGTTGKSLRLEAVQIYLSGEISNYYDLYYRVNAKGLGWMKWVKNGNPAGTVGYGRRLTGIQIRLVKKGAATANSYKGVKSVTKTGFVKKESNKTPINPYYEEHPEENPSRERTIKREHLEPVTLTAKEFDLLAAVVYCEAGGEIMNGQVAMANIVLNRLRSGNYGKNLHDVVYAPYQFSVVSLDKFKDALKNGVPQNTRIACRRAVNGLNFIRDYVNVRPTWYYDLNKLPDSVHEYIILGNIIFFK